MVDRLHLQRAWIAPPKSPPWSFELKHCIKPSDHICHSCFAGAIVEVSIIPYPKPTFLTWPAQTARCDRLSLVTGLLAEAAAQRDL